VHVIYSYDDKSIAVVNSGPERAPIRGVHLQTKVFNVDGTQRSASDTVIDIPADSSMRVTRLGEQATDAPYFVDLRLIDANGRGLARNLYWLANKMDVLSDSSTWYMTPVNAYADFTALRSMPMTNVSASATFARNGETGTARVTLKNPSDRIAFFMRLQVTGKGGAEVLPVMWEDNYISLLPGETRTLSATYNVRDLGGASPKVVVTGWNIHRVIVP
jgi:exo-1,4-beta-D-glucosaminidase